jgi:hypothetical protein
MAEQGATTTTTTVFDWGRRRGRRIRLGLLIAVSFAIHAFAFYLFQVDYPPSERFIPRPAKVTLIREEDALSQGVLEAVEDRLSAFEPTPSEGLENLAISELPARFEPAFDEYSPSLKPFPKAETSPKVAMAGGISLDPRSGADLSLPPLGPKLKAEMAAMGNGGEPAAKPPPGPVAIGLGRLGVRLSSKPIRLGAELLKKLPAGSAKFYVVVSPAGRVRHCFFSRNDLGSVMEGDVAASLVRSVERVPFEPAPEPLTGDVGGWVEVNW